MCRQTVGMGMMKDRIQLMLLAVWGLLVCGSAAGQNLEQAKRLYQAGEYEQARPMFEALIKKNPNNASLNQWYGACLYETGAYEASEKYLKTAASRKVQEAYLYLGRLYDYQYRFAAALENYEKYRELQLKNKQDTEETDRIMARLKMGEQMVRRVEEVQIIDSMIVDKSDFLKHYRLSPESGRLTDYNAFFSTHTPDTSTVYQNQKGDNIVYAARTARNGYDLMSRSRLVDGSWGEALPLTGNVNNEADQNYPFLLSDGLTLYYASTGEASLGGYDIFVTRLNLNTGNFLAPENLGMPFNSPYNDYMLAIDELNDVGWFATDRYQPEDKVIIYVFIPNTEKQIYQGGDEAWARSLGKIASIRQTWKTDNAYARILQHIYTMPDAEERAPEADFVFVVNNQLVYNSLDDFECKEAKDLYIKADECRKQIAAAESRLSELRKRYVGEKKNRAALVGEIEKLESALVALYGQPEELDNRSRAAEINLLLKSGRIKTKE